MKDERMCEKLAGKLFLVATPIGNLGDITFRAVEILRNVDMIACEDTRHTIKLLNHLSIKKKMISYFEHNKAEKGEYIISLIGEGKDVALVSDAGTPAISDPGEELVALAIEKGIQVVPVPGAVAFISALIGSGMHTSRFVFEGFLPVNKKTKRERIEALSKEDRTIIFYEAPHKLLVTLKVLKEILGERRIVLAREITKLHEEFIYATIEEALIRFESQAPRGEFVIIVNGYEKKIDDVQELPKEELSDESINQNIKNCVDAYILKGVEKKEAIKKVAKDLKLLKRDVYIRYI